jgi:hypothetical protein
MLSGLDCSNMPTIPMFEETDVVNGENEWKQSNYRENLLSVTESLSGSGAEFPLEEKFAELLLGVRWKPKL